MRRTDERRRQSREGAPTRPERSSRIRTSGSSTSGAPRSRRSTTLRSSRPGTTEPRRSSSVSSISRTRGSKGLKTTGRVRVVVPVRRLVDRLHPDRVLHRRGALPDPREPRAPGDDAGRLWAHARQPHAKGRVRPPSLPSSSERERAVVDEEGMASRKTKPEFVRNGHLDYPQPSTSRQSRKFVKAMRKLEVGSIAPSAGHAAEESWETDRTSFPNRRSSTRASATSSRSSSIGTPSRGSR